MSSISSISYTQPSASVTSRSIAQQIAAAESKSSTDTSSSVTISQAGEAASKIGSTSGATYDFTNMTPQQMLSTMNDLIKSGKMTLDQSSPLVGMIPTALSKVNYDGQPPASFYQPMNFMTGLTSGIAGAQSRGDTTSAAFLTAALNALQSLQGTASSSTTATNKATA